MNILISILLTIIPLSLQTQTAINCTSNCNRERKTKFSGIRMGPDLVRANGFPLEEHSVVSGGYITTLFRIPHGRFGVGATNKKVALLHHGLIEDGFVWTLNGVEKALGYRLADLDVDVWLTNNRGTYHSLGHTRMDWTHFHYWNFSFHEIGFDVPRIIDYILEETGQSDLYYLGHSMGCAAFFVAMSVFPEYQSKIRTFIGLAPAVYLGRTTAPFQQFIPAILKQQELYDRILAVPFVPPELIPFMQIIGALCSNRVTASWLCFSALESIFGYDLQEANYELGEEIFANGLSSASMKSVFHLLQSWQSGKFQYYNYMSRNQEVYGSLQPPNYNLESVNVPTVLFCGWQDNIVTCEDVYQLSQDLPNVKEFKTVGWSKFNHIDFMFAVNINPLVNDRIVEIIENDIYYKS